MVIIDTPEGISFFALLQIKYRLKIEVETGLKFSGSPTTLQWANRIMDTKFRTKKEALVAFTEYVERVKNVGNN